MSVCRVKGMKLDRRLEIDFKWSDNVKREGRVDAHMNCIPGAAYYIQPQYWVQVFVYCT